MRTESLRNAHDQPMTNRTYEPSARVDHLVDSPLSELALEQVGLLSVRQCLEYGVSRGVVGRRVERGTWTRVARGVVDTRPSDDPLPAQAATRRAVVRALLEQGPGAIATGPAALVLHGVWGVPRGLVAQVAQAHATKREPRASRCRRFRSLGRVVTIGGVRGVSVELALAQAVCELAPRTALGVLDSALHLGILSFEGLAEVRALARGRRGVRKLVHVWSLVDDRRESPLESWAYYDLWQAGLRPTDVQVAVRDVRGRPIGRADFGYLLVDGTWLLVELDGRDFHTGAAAVAHDYGRANAFSLASNATVVRFVNEHLGPDGAMVRRLRAFLSGRWWAPSIDRSVWSGIPSESGSN